MKVIDLLNKIANGEKPLIKEGTNIYKYDEIENDYITGMGYDYERYFYNIENILNSLNDEVELLAEVTFSEKELDYRDLVGVKINKVEIDDKYITFITENNKQINIKRFIPYCACSVGEYIDDISYNGYCNGIITDIDTNIDTNIDDYDVYKGSVSFYFENGKINMNVHGEDNGYYGVSFTMPIEIIDIEDVNKC